VRIYCISITMNRLPDELQRMIYSYAPIKSPTSALIDDLRDCRQNEPLDDGGTDFHLWWGVYFKNRTNTFNPTKYRCEIGMFACDECGYELSWNDYQVEGYDHMCEECYTQMYHPDAVYNHSNPITWDDSDSDESDEDSDEDDSE